jgi:hypothetical protein
MPHVRHVRSHTNHIRLGEHFGIVTRRRFETCSYFRTSTGAVAGDADHVTLWVLLWLGKWLRLQCSSLFMQ